MIFYNELILAINNFQIPFILGNQDISSRYKRSKIGAFWITINLLVFIITLSFVFGHLFNNRIEVILPMLATGLIAWNFLSSLIIESSKAFVDSGSLILQTNAPILVHLLRVLCDTTHITLILVTFSHPPLAIITTLNITTRILINTQLTLPPLEHTGTSLGSGRQEAAFCFDRTLRKGSRIFDSKNQGIVQIFGIGEMLLKLRKREL